MATNNATNNAGFQVLRTYPLAGSPHTWTKPAAFTPASFIEVWVFAGGGGSGGTAATGVGEGAESGGGGSGAPGYKKIDAASLGATETITIGAGGAAGTAGANNGGTGGTSSFGAHLSCTGGTGGTGGGNSTAFTAAGGSAGVATGSDIPYSASNGAAGIVRSGVPGFNSQGGGNAFSPPVSTNAVGSGNVGRPLGGGASGASSAASTAARAGSVGSDGYCIVKEYY